MPISLKRDRLGATHSSLRPHLFVVSPDGIAKISQSNAISSSLGALADYEMLAKRRKREKVPKRLSELCRTFGFEWEPLSEVGHMRFLPRAAFMVDQVRQYAASTAQRAAALLDIPFFRLEGVNVVDPSSRVMQAYAALIENEPGLYGSVPYRIQGASPLILRQTGCLQKFSISRSLRFGTESLPIALFETSDSYRREPKDTLQLCARVRRFRLPEMHIHTPTTTEAVGLVLNLHQVILGELSRLSEQYEILVSAPHKFVLMQKAFLRKLAYLMKKPFLLKAYPPDMLCEDGVEVDIEYKVIDSMGCPREFSTLQVDEQITRTFGITYSTSRGQKSFPSTIHAVLTGSIERHLYLLLDRIVRSERQRTYERLPLWLSPVAARFISSDDRTLALAIQMADQAQEAGVRVDIDDRPYRPEMKLAEADSELVPYAIMIRSSDPTIMLLMRSYRGSVRPMFWEQILQQLIREHQLENASRIHLRQPVTKLSRLSHFGFTS